VVLVNPGTLAHAGQLISMFDCVLVVHQSWTFWAVKTI